MSDADSTAGASPPLLDMLQLSDSMFPSGATAFSWGLESLQCDGVPLNVDALHALMTTLLGQRWAGFDRPMLVAAWHLAGAPDPLAPVIELDQRCEAMTLTAGLRAASRRLGFTQLRVHAELGSCAAADYLAVVRDDRAPGHLAVVQGWLWAQRGLSLTQAETMSAYALSTAVSGAAMRLGLIGHVDAQRLLTAMRPVIAAVLTAPCIDVDDAWNGAPALEVAAMRHEPRRARLFAT